MRYFKSTDISAATICFDFTYVVVGSTNVVVAAAVVVVVAATVAVVVAAASVVVVPQPVAGVGTRILRFPKKKNKRTKVVPRYHEQPAQKNFVSLEAGYLQALPS